MEWLEIFYQIILVFVSLVSSIGVTVGFYWIQQVGKALNTQQCKLEAHSIEMAELKTKLYNSQEQISQHYNRNEKADIRITKLERDQSVILSSLQSINNSVSYIRNQVDDIKERI